MSVVSCLETPEQMRLQGAGPAPPDGRLRILSSVWRVGRASMNRSGS